MVTIAVFFDLSKAFDRIDHQILLEKLAALNCSYTVLKWFRSYLTGRSQVVRDPESGGISTPAFINMGVPQGSVLGPILFTLYVSDLCGSLRHCEYNIYADDLMIYFHCEPRFVGGGVDSVNGDISRIISWAQKNKLTFNAEKTSATIFGTGRFVNALAPESMPGIEVDGTPVKFSTSVKYLGVTLTDRLSWGPHINNITRKIRTTLYQLGLCRSLLPGALRRRLVALLVLPHIDYCSAVLTDITAGQSDQLQRALNVGVRFIFGVRRDSHISPFWERLGWLRVDSRRLYMIGCHLEMAAPYTVGQRILFADLRVREEHEGPVGRVVFSPVQNGGAWALFQDSSHRVME